MVAFQNRQEAGRKLAQALEKYRGQKDLVVIGLPRGGVVLAYEVACYLQAPLDVVSPRKVGAPFNPELAIGAVTETGEGYFNEELIQSLSVSSEYIRSESAKEQEKAKRRLETLRKGRPPLTLKDKTVILVDDGLATGATMKAAIFAVRKKKAKMIIAAVPVSPPDTALEIQGIADELICLETPWIFQAVGQFYREFDQTEDAEVLKLLSKNTTSDSSQTS